MDLSELPKELNTNKMSYLFSIIVQFSKFGMAFIVENKEATIILKYLKIALECNGYQEELGSDNGKEFKNKIIENYLKEHDIKYILCAPYNPHSQGVVERFHQTLKDLIYSIYSDDNSNFILKEALEIAKKNIIITIYILQLNASLMKYFIQILKNFWIKF